MRTIEKRIVFLDIVPSQFLDDPFFARDAKQIGIVSDDEFVVLTKMHVEFERESVLDRMGKSGKGILRAA